MILLQMVKKMRKKDMYVVGIDVLIVLALIIWKKELWMFFVVLGVMSVMSYYRTMHLIQNTQGKDDNSHDQKS